MCLLALFAAGAEPVRVTVALDDGLRLKEALGDRIYEVEELTVTGLVKSEDFPVMWDCGFNGKCRVLNLEAAEIEYGLVPVNAFYIGEFQNVPGSSQFVPLKFEEIVLPEGVETIDTDAFRGVRFKHFDIPSTVRVVAWGAFGSTGLESVTIPDGINSVFAMAFARSALREVYVPASSLVREVTYTNVAFASVFYECAGLKRLVIGEGAEGVGYQYASCCDLEEIVLPQSLTSIGGDAFSHNERLEAVCIPANVVTIGSAAFWGCGLQTVMFEGAPALSDHCFADLPYLQRIYSKSATPPACVDASVFGGTTPADATVYVPLGSADRYRADPGWNRLSNFVETDDFPETGTAAATLGGQEIAAAMQGALRVYAGDNDAEYAVCTVGGVIVASGRLVSGGEATIRCAPGIYIVSVGERNCKLTVQ